MFKILVLSVALLGCTLGDDLLDVAIWSALNNPTELGGMFTAFEESHHRQYNPVEKQARMSVFKNNLKEIYVHNHAGTSWKEGVNDFTDQTDAEKATHLGLNVTNVYRNVQKVVKRDNVATPDRVSWIEQGAVTAMKNQGSCGSCWAFGAVGSLEGVYKRETGVLRAFSEQQVLDCTYDRDGCQGGWMRDGINGIRDTTAGRCASMADYPYVASDGSCRNEGSALVGARVTGYIDIEEGEASTIAALSQQPLSVTICVINSFYSYSSGIYRDDTQTSFPNHALTAVAYTPEYVLVKNSWGTDWGDDGFIKVARNYNGCSFHTYVGYATLESTGETDTSDSDAATDYDPQDEDVDPDCVDNFTGCDEEFCHYTLIYRYCQRTCGDCEEEGECPSGTIMCDDGVCRHEHMC